MNPEATVQRQFDAFNARDVDAFVAQFSADIEAFRPPADAPALVGKEALKKFYATQRFNLTGLHARLLNRMVIGNKVIDHERISGVREQPHEVVVVYEVVDGLIRRTWSFLAD